MKLPTFAAVELKREAVDILLDWYKRMDAVKKTLSVFEESTMVMYVLRLYQETNKMTAADAAMIEARVQALRTAPHAEQLPAPLVAE